jgi:hypothetical protein
MYVNEEEYESDSFVVDDDIELDEECRRELDKVTNKRKM